MRLLDTRTLRMVEFNFPPPYAILSHRWDDHEVSYEEFITTKDKTGPEFKKVIQFCIFALNHGHDYVWIDCCCIDKRSSAELSEAINSMWSWYSEAKECIALLVDVSVAEGENPYKLGKVMNDFQRSIWFSRGWTLQELLAPRVVTFVSSQWVVLGDKTDDHLLPLISNRTGIPENCLTNQFALHSTCVAQKLSWASKRQTTRVEDTAYCLMGLLDVNMPLLYGEGNKAFLRLQQEIIRQSDDESIFAWRHVSPPPNYMTGVLASHVQLFENSGDVRKVPGTRLPYAITNKGLQFHSDATFILNTNIKVIPLNCVYGVEPNVSQCTMAVILEEDACYRFGTSRLGEHLDNMFAKFSTEKRENVMFHVTISRWQHTFQPAMFLIRRSLERFRQRKAMELEKRKALKLLEESHEKSSTGT